jgi:hypothetical protein
VISEADLERLRNNASFKLSPNENYSSVIHKKEAWSLKPFIFNFPLIKIFPCVLLPRIFRLSAGSKMG